MKTKRLNKRLYMPSILVISNNSAETKNISAVLKDRYTILSAKTEAKGLQICSEENPDLIIMDIEVPGIKGFKILGRLRTNPRLYNIPVIFLSSNYDTAEELAAFETGNIDFVLKPIKSSVLLRCIGLHLKLSSYEKVGECMANEFENNIALSFAEYVDYRKKNIKTNPQRISSLIKIIGRELLSKGCFLNELDEETIIMISRAALLHDIGEIDIYDTLLLKPDQLNPEEFQQIKKHPIYGAEILREMRRMTQGHRFLIYAEEIAECHHEKYDGSGYPRGLFGDNIPLCARITALADMYDALTSERTYRKALSHEEAFNIITAGKGTYFDPRIVDAFEAAHWDMKSPYSDFSCFSNLKTTVPRDIPESEAIELFAETP
ncbi:MAG: response regulator [Treponema sp.]|nr:response regulator [Treponema sp.]